ncbi:MAG: hypothetical protein ACLUYV_01520 [Alistipes shahii]
MPESTDVSTAISWCAAVAEIGRASVSRRIYDSTGICERMNESLASPESVVAVMTAVRFSVIEVFSE